MARTRSADYDVAQEGISKGAAAVFARQGFSATSISDIAAACGCSKSRLYHYFDSKEDILKEILTAHIDGLLQRCRETVRAHREPEERFRQVVRLLMQVYAVSEDEHRTLLTCLQELSVEPRNAIIAKQRELIGYVRDNILQIRPDLAAHPSDNTVNVMLFFGMINWTYTWYSSEGKLTPEELADRAVELFLDGFRALHGARNG